jgi:DNA polymerase III subunit epsilon
MSYAILDTETSGLPRYNLPADDPAQPHVAAVALILVDEQFKVEREYEVLIKPDGWEMEPGAMAVNGLTMERLNDSGIPIMEALPVYTDAIDEGRTIVAHNCRFDTKCMRGELRRAKIDDRFDRTKTICTMQGCVGVVKAPPSNSMMAGGRKTFKMPKLAEAYRHFFKREIVGAHSALVDARACLDIFRKLNEIGCCPEAAVYHAKDGTRAGEALRLRQEADAQRAFTRGEAESTEETMGTAHGQDEETI